MERSSASKWLRDRQQVPLRNVSATSVTTRYWRLSRGFSKASTPFQPSLRTPLARYQFSSSQVSKLPFQPCLYPGLNFLPNNPQSFLHLRLCFFQPVLLTGHCEVWAPHYGF